MGGAFAVAAWWCCGLLEGSASEPRFPGDVRVAARSHDGVSEGVAALAGEEDVIGVVFREG